ncbi:MAG: hypothetical protein R3F48_10130 [Candidatus Zixiibacteriota bacterium]
MRLCSSKLFVFATLILLLVAVFGCSQKDDVLKPQNKASLTLRPSYLPELEAMYTYEFWAFSVDGTDTTFTSLGKFLWDSELYRFRNVDGTLRDSVFELPEAYAEYDYFAVTIENSTDPSPTIPSGAFMLVDEVVDPVSRPIELKFPVDLFSAKGYFFIGTPTDDTTNLANETKGIWLCSQVETQRILHDTLGVVRDSVIATPAPDDDPNANLPDTIGVIFPPGGVWDIIDTVVILRYDTIPHRRIDIQWETVINPDTNYIVFVDYDIDSLSADPTHPLGTILYNDYQNTFEESMPDISAYGWQYNAWVFHEYYPDAADIEVGAPFGYQLQRNVTAARGWKVLPLGAFARPDSADMDNQYGDNLEVPNFPGEDFIDNLPAGYDEIDFSRNSFLSRADLGNIDTSAGEWGAVVVGIQPIPTAQLSVDETRNFPIFIMSQFLADSTAYGLQNYTQFLPTIAVEVTFKE